MYAMNLGMNDVKLISRMRATATKRTPAFLKARPEASDPPRELLYSTCMLLPYSAILVVVSRVRANKELLKRNHCKESAEGNYQ